MKFNIAIGVVLSIFLISLQASSTPTTGSEFKISTRQLQTPILKNKSNNAVLRICIEVTRAGHAITEFNFNSAGTSNIKDIKSAQIFYFGKDSLAGNLEKTKAEMLSSIGEINGNFRLKFNKPLQAGKNYFWLSYELDEKADLMNQVDASLVSLTVDGKKIKAPEDNNKIIQRIGIALRKAGQDGVHTSRIPGLATSNKGTLLAIFDARYQSGRDLQGHMDIGLHRSEDQGKTWQPIQIAMDMGSWGGLPEKFNGVSDACILVDRNSNAIYIAGLWMHGVINDQGRWIDNLQDNPDAWNHQWRTKGSGPGFGVKQTSQFLIVKSTDDGKTWSEPVNLTSKVKKKEWWLWAPAPGQGITLDDGTLVFPTQGRDHRGEAFSNITYSKDGGRTWKTSEPAAKESTTECMAVQLSSGELMLNMRANANKGDTSDSNGRAVATTADLGKSWRVHPSSHKALIEPVCMASIIKHEYTSNGNKKSVLLFSNPNSKTKRDHLTIKHSFDDGMSWSDNEHSVLLDELSSRGYSCLTSIDGDTIGILYESSGADLVFQTIKLADLLQ